MVDLADLVDRGGIMCTRRAIGALCRYVVMLGSLMDAIEPCAG